MTADLRRLAENPPKDAKERRELCEAARALYTSLWTPSDAAGSIFGSVSTVFDGDLRPDLISRLPPEQCQKLPMAQIGVDTGLFRTLAKEPEKDWDLKELAKVTHVDPTLLYRLNRYYVSFNLIEGRSDGTYSANDITCWLATPRAEGGIKHYFKLVTPVARALPEVLQEQNYRNPTDSSKTAFAKAYNVTSGAYSWTPEDPTLLPAFHAYMKSLRANRKSWTEAFPMETLQLSQDDVQSGRAIFVDVGGNQGGQCISFRELHPDLYGKVVVQDIASVIEKADHEALKKHDVEAIVHDFFEPQPIERAKAYYMRNIMHDWTDDKCVEILKRLREVLANDSVILIHDNVLPDFGASWKEAQNDLQMMAAHAALERSVTQWKELLAQARLKIREIVRYDQDASPIIVAVAA